MTKMVYLSLMHETTGRNDSLGKGKVREMTYEYIKAYFLKNETWNLDYFTVPTFKEALFWSNREVLRTVDCQAIRAFKRKID